MIPGEAKSPELTPKGQRTRARIVAAARDVFERTRSYTETRIADIAKAAGVSYGSFYSYFQTKEQLFSELANEVVDDLYITGTSDYRAADPGATIDSANRRFATAYRKNAVMMMILDQAAALFPEFHELRVSRRRRFVDRVAGSVGRWHRQGLVDDAIDPVVAAQLLVSMTDNLCYVWFVLEEPLDEDTTFKALARLWNNALRTAEQTEDSALDSDGAAARSIGVPDREPQALRDAVKRVLAANLALYGTR